MKNDDEKVLEKHEASGSPKLSPCVPEKVLQMWYVENKKGNFEVKRVLDNHSAKAIVEWDGKMNILKNSVGSEIRVYKTFGEAAEMSMLRQIEDKKKKWDAYVKASMLLGDQIGILYEQLNKIQSRDKKNTDEDSED